MSLLKSPFKVSIFPDSYRNWADESVQSIGGQGCGRFIGRRQRTVAGHQQDIFATLRLVLPSRWRSR